MSPRTPRDWDLTRVPPPWGDRPSTYERLRADPSAAPEVLAAARQRRTDRHVNR